MNTELVESSRDKDDSYDKKQKNATTPRRQLINSFLTLKAKIHSTAETKR